MLLITLRYFSSKLIKDLKQTLEIVIKNKIYNTMQKSTTIPKAHLATLRMKYNYILNFRQFESGENYSLYEWHDSMRQYQY